MTLEETLDLLALAACFDQRTVGHADARAWHAVAQTQGWTFPLAKQAVIEYYSRHRQRLMPADVSHRITEVRAHLHETFELPQHPPELADDGAAFVAWARRVKAAHMTAGLTEWATSGRLPPPRELEA